jgi:hypothetical protein
MNECEAIDRIGHHKYTIPVYERLFSEPTLFYDDLEYYDIRNVEIIDGKLSQPPKRIMVVAEEYKPNPIIAVEIKNNDGPCVEAFICESS